MNKRLTLSTIALLCVTMTVNALTKSGNEYQITSAQDLIDFATLVNNGTTNANAKLTKDIDLSGKTYTPIGTSSKQYSGTFNGNDKSIKNLTFSDLQKHRGIFGCVGKNGIIQNLTLGGNCTIKGTGNIGGIAGLNYGIITNCKVNNTVSVAGGVSYEAYWEGTLYNFGGIVGRNEGSISKCTNAASVSYNTSNSDVSLSNFGGIAGNNLNSGNIAECQNIGSIKGILNVGGIVGNNQATVMNSLNTASIIGNNSSSGGIIGKNNGTATNNYYAGSCNLGGISNVDAIDKAMKGLTILSSDSRVSLSLSSPTGLEIDSIIYAGQEQSVTLTLSPTSDVRILDVTVNAGSINNIGNNQFSLLMANTNAILTVTLEEIPTKISINIGSNGIATFCCPYDIDFSGIEGLTAYIVSGFSPSAGQLTLTSVGEVPAGEGLLLRGTKGNYDVPCITTDAYYSNLLTGVTTTTEISPIDGDQTNFILANGSHGINFYTLSGTGNLAAGKAYLHLPSSAVSAITNNIKGFIFLFDGENNETTGFNGVYNQKEIDQCYDLQGRRISQLIRGLYIINGKKLIKK